MIPAARLVSPRQGIIIIIVYAAGKPSFVIGSYTRHTIDCMRFTPPVRNPIYAAYHALFTVRQANLPEIPPHLRRLRFGLYLPIGR